MSGAQFFYEKTPVNGIGTAQVTSGVTVGIGGSKEDDYERFAGVISDLEALEKAGLIDITFRHPESLTGKKFTDLVTFKRLK